jgi:hypothetical protein
MQSKFLTTARIAGLLYLVVAVCGGFAKVVRTSVVESGDAAATAQNILDSEFLFRVGFSSDSIAFSAEIALAVVFYALFSPVNKTLAIVSAGFRLGQAVTLAANMLNQFMALLLLKGDDYLGVFAPDQVDALVLLFMDAHEVEYFIGLVFFGIATFFLGYLVLKSGAFPPIFGVALMLLVPAGYILDSFTSFLIEDKDDIISVVLIAPAAITEIVFVLWLLVKGGSIQEPLGSPQTQGA